MTDTNYRIEALEYLLDKGCLAERYYPLVGLKEELIEKLRKLGCKRKKDIEELSDADFGGIGIEDGKTIGLIRRFLKIYEPNPQKFREIDRLDINDEEKNAFRELYCLLGVKYTRANLYYSSGYRSLKDIAAADEAVILERTAKAIKENKMACIVPLPKEVRTHVAVARAFTEG